ncbi:hypothetical protein TNCV_492901, partial [Trichonephila clavipes]
MCRPMRGHFPGSRLINAIPGGSVSKATKRRRQVNIDRAPADFVKKTVVADQCED